MDLPIESGGSFHSFMLTFTRGYQKLSSRWTMEGSPEWGDDARLSGSTGKISTGKPWIFPCMGVSMGVRFFFVPPIH